MIGELFLIGGSTALIFYVIWFVCRRIGLLDRPGPDVPKRGRVPTLQGISIVVTVILLVALLRPTDLLGGVGSDFLGLWVGGGLIFLVVLIDELGRFYPLLRVSAKVRLLIQICAACCAVFLSGVMIDGISLPNGEFLEFGLLLSSLLTIAWFLLFINAINWFDGIYGLASGMSSIGFFSLWLLIGVVVFPLYTNVSLDKLLQLEAIQWYALLFGTVSLAATILEFRPWGVVRDVGTMVLGFVLGYLALLGGAKIGTTIVVLMLPLFDAVRVIIDRVRRRKKYPLKGDYSHLHHRLLALGWNRTEIRVMIRGVSIFLLVLMLLQGGDRTGKIIIFVMCAVVFFGINWYLFWKKGLPSEYQWDANAEKEKSI